MITCSPVEEAVNALARVQQVGIVEDSTKHSLVVQVLHGAKHVMAHRVTKKEPITPDILSKLVERFGHHMQHYLTYGL